MAVKSDQTPQPLVDEKIGILRRIWRGRIWYGTEWYITMFGGLILVLVLLMTTLAPIIAPHDPNGFVGAQFVIPGEGKQILIGLANDSRSINSNNLSEFLVGAERNKNGVNTAEDLGAEAQRIQTEAELHSALASGEIDVILINEELEKEVLTSNPTFEVIERDLGFNFPMGTDNLGRDMVSRILWGARTVMSVALASALLSSTVGISLGLISGFAGGWLDRLLSLIMDSLYSFPGLLLAIAMVAMLGPGMLNVAVAVSVIYIPTFFRVVRGQVLSVREELYVEAARSLGAKSYSILIQYVLPNVIPSIVVVFSLNIADAILTEAGLSFIGLGLPPDIPDWGYDLSKGHGYLVSGRWWLITYPGLMITLVAAGFSLLGEGLSEILNPRLTKN